jgi:hypothetical protein
MHRVSDGSGELCDGRVTGLGQKNGQYGHHDHKDGIWQVALGERHTLILRYPYAKAGVDVIRLAKAGTHLCDFAMVMMFLKRTLCLSQYKDI